MSESQVVLPNHKLPICKDGGYKKSFPNLEAAESFAQHNFETYGSLSGSPQNAYQCPFDPNHFHLTTRDDVPLEERSSSPYARAVLPVAPDTDEGEKFQPTRAAIEERRGRVYDFFIAHPDTTYDEAARLLNIASSALNYDVTVLIKQGKLTPRAVGRPRIGGPGPYIKKASSSAKTKLAEIDAALRKMLEAKAELELVAAREEAERIEREKFHVDWVAADSGNGAAVLRVRKNTTYMTFPVEVWQEIMAAVAAEIQEK